MWILFLVMAGVWVKKPKVKKRLFIAAVVVLLIFSNHYLVSRFAGWWDYPRPVIDTTKTYSCAIVLGGFVSEDAQGQGFFNGSADRFIQGLRLTKTGQVSHILISSGNADLIPDQFREGDWVGHELKAMNVPDSAILIEDQSRNTIENARFTKALLLKQHLQPPYLLVTSAFHMRRARAIFEKEHIPVIPYACCFDGQPAKLSLNDLLPDAASLNAWTHYFKEAVGLWLVKHSG